MTVDASPYERRAVALWPRLDREKLRRTRGDPVRIARLVSRRTTLSVETIVLMLLMVDVLT
jgi:hypothetical protein